MLATLDLIDFLIRATHVTKQTCAPWIKSQEKMTETTKRQWHLSQRRWLCWLRRARWEWLQQNWNRHLAAHQKSLNGECLCWSKTKASVKRVFESSCWITGRSSPLMTRQHSCSRHINARDQSTFFFSWRRRSSPGHHLGCNPPPAAALQFT